MIDKSEVNFRKFLFWFSIFILVNFVEAYAQVDIKGAHLIGQHIDSIEIKGNKVTRAEIILREMRIKPGTVISQELLTADLLHIMGLDLFSRVEFELSEVMGKRVLTIEVTEEWYIFPMPFWDISSDTPHEITYGFRFVQRNFRGRAETLRFSLWGGDDRGFRFRHNTPWVQSTPQFMRYIDLRQITRKSRNLAIEDLDLETRHTEAQVFFGKRWTLEFTSSVGTRFRMVEGEDPRQLASAGEIDRVQEAMVWAVWDARDLRQFPRRGMYADLWFSQGWVLNSSHQFQRVWFDFRKYVPWKALAFCTRVIWNPGWGVVPPYDWIIVRQTTPIRSSRLSDEGKSFAFMSLETRFDIMQLRYFTWHSAPKLIRQHVRNLKYGLAAEVFLDAGDAYSNVSSVGMESVMWGYGFGLLLRLPYVDVIRLESSWNPEYSISDFRLSWKIGISF